MKKVSKKIVTGLLCGALALSMAVPAFAEEVTVTPTEQTETVTDEEILEAEGDTEVVASGEYGKNVIWTLNDEGTLTVSGSGKITYSVAEAGINTYCKQIKNIVISNGITSIGQCAFTFCSNVKNIKLPNSITFIGDGAFCGCSALHNITLSDKLTTIDDNAFNYCENLTSIIIPASVKSIGYAAFSNCVSLTKVTFEKNSKLKSIDSSGNGAFGCPGLKHDDRNENLMFVAEKGSYAAKWADQYGINFSSIDVSPVKKIKLSATSYVYDGKSHTPKIKIICENKSRLEEGKDYIIQDRYLKFKTNGRVTTVSNCINAGEYSLVVDLKNDYSGQLWPSFTIKKAANTLKLSASKKTFYSSALKNQDITYNIKIKTAGIGKITYTKSSEAKTAGIKVSSKGKIRVPKGCKKGSYIIKVKAKGDKNHKAKTLNFKVVVK